MTVRQNVTRFTFYVLIWGAFTASAGLPQWVAAVGGTLIGAIFFFPTIGAISRANRGEDQQEFEHE
jgi:hypothetical protein